MENRAIRITIELPQDLVAASETVAGAAGVTASVAGIEPASQHGSGSMSGPGAESEPAGPPIDAGAPPPHLIAALGGEAGLSGRGIQTDGNGTGSGEISAQENIREERAIDAGALPEHVVSLLETSGPRHPMAESADFRAAFTAEDAVQRN